MLSSVLIPGSKAEKVKDGSQYSQGVKYLTGMAPDVEGTRSEPLRHPADKHYHSEQERQPLGKVPLATDIMAHMSLTQRRDTMKERQYGGESDEGKDAAAERSHPAAAPTGVQESSRRS